MQSRGIVKPAVFQPLIAAVKCKNMITDAKKKLIESLSLDEMLYEINLGRRSRFQRDAFSYLQTCYQQTIEKEKLKNLASKNQSTDKSTNITDEKHYPGEGSLKKISIGVVIVVLGSMALWGLNHYFNLGL